MDQSTIHTVVSNQIEERERVLAQENIIDRKVLEHWKGSIDTDLIKVIYGPRRSGKSTFAFQLLRNKNYAYINLDDNRLADIGAKELDDILTVSYDIQGEFREILLDEIQNVPGWELFVNRLAREGYNVVITGSSANLLSKELATHLTGRYLPIGMYPFSFSEFLEFNGLKVDKKNVWNTRNKSRIITKLNDYMKSGGFPEALKYPEYDKQYLSTLYSDIISKDVISRYNIRYIRTLKDIANYLMTNSSNLVTFNRLKNKFGLKSGHTAKNYVSYLQEASMFIILDKFSYKQGIRSSSPKKVYAVDTGLINAVAFPTSDNIGPLMENIVAVELMRKKTIQPGTDIFYWRDYQDHEVDFAVKKGQKVEELIQVTYCSGPDEIDKRELRSLIKASDELKCKSLNVITWDYYETEERNGKTIKYIPLWYWLTRDKKR